MKKLITLFLLSSLILTSCNSKKSEESFSVDTANSKIIWTAYKTTDKVPVQGEFKEVKVKDGNGTSIEDAVSNLKFTIPVSSIFTNNTDRDKKILDHFFAVMINSMSLKGSIHLEENNKAYAQLSLNGVSSKLPLNYEIHQNVVKLTGVLELDQWEAMEAVKSINDACYDLHKGADGVSKTWSDVAIDLSIPVIKK